MSVGGKVIWITGASSGIGRALAIRLSDANRLIISGRNREELDKTASACTGEVKVLAFDLADLGNTDAHIAEALSAWKRIDVFIHSGGISQRSLARETEFSVTENIIKVNFFSAVKISEHLLPGMRTNKHGQIVIISSLLGKFGSSRRTSYAASKHALHGYFDSLRMEEEHNGIEIMLVCPYAVNTDMAYNSLDGSGAPMNQQDPLQESGLDADFCARRIVEGMGKGKRELIIGKKGKISLFLYRFFPRLFRQILRKKMK